MKETDMKKKRRDVSEGKMKMKEKEKEDVGSDRLQTKQQAQRQAQVVSDLARRGTVQQAYKQLEKTQVRRERSTLDFC